MSTVREAGRGFSGETRDALVAPHVGRRLEDRRSDKVALLEPGNLDAPTVEEDLASLVLARLDQLLDALLRLRRDERAAEETMWSARAWFQEASAEMASHIS